MKFLQSSIKFQQKAARNCKRLAILFETLFKNHQNVLSLSTPYKIRDENVLVFLDFGEVQRNANIVDLVKSFQSRS